MRILLTQHRSLFSLRTFYLFSVGIILGLSITVPAIAQDHIETSPTDRPSDKLPLPIEKEQPLVPPPDVIPTSPPAGDEEAVEKMPLLGVFVRKIVVIGSTVFTTEELNQIKNPYENRTLNNEDLERLRRDLTLLYINNGYYSSGAIIPDQSVVDDTIRFHIIEGQLGAINVEGNRWLRDSYIKKRIALGTVPPLNIETIQESLQVLEQNPRIALINAELKSTAALGESDLNIDITEELPFKIWTGFDNYLSKSVGSEQLRLNVTDLSLTGNGDTLNFIYGYAEGLHPKIDVSYAFPFTARDSTLYLRYRKNDFDVVREAFEELNIQTDSDIYTVALSRPVFRRPSHELVLSLVGEYAEQQTTLLNLPFSLEPGAEQGEVNVAAVRFSQDYTYRSQTQVISGRSQFSLGVDALDATTRDADLPDSEFFKWLGQFQWVNRFKFYDIQSVLRTDCQFSADPLVSLEQFPIGGRYTVRGYPENTLVRDNAVIASLEFRIPIVQERVWADYLQVVPFFDFGWGENKDFPTPEPRDIYSVGIGLKWAVTIPAPFRLGTQLEIFWGKQLREIEDDDEKDYLVDDGIHFQIAVSAL
jgi:hemolysin activation/secretion protein